MISTHPRQPDEPTADLESMAPALLASREGICCPQYVSGRSRYVPSAIHSCGLWHLCELRLIMKSAKIQLSPNKGNLDTTPSWPKFAMPHSALKSNPKLAKLPRGEQRSVLMCAHGIWARLHIYIWHLSPGAPGALTELLHHSMTSWLPPFRSVVIAHSHDTSSQNSHYALLHNSNFTSAFVTLPLSIYICKIILHFLSIFLHESKDQETY